MDHSRNVLPALLPCSVPHENAGEEDAYSTLQHLELDASVLLVALIPVETDVQGTIGGEGAMDAAEIETEVETMAEEEIEVETTVEVEIDVVVRSDVNVRLVAQAANVNRTSAGIGNVLMDLWLLFRGASAPNWISLGFFPTSSEVI